MFKIKCVPGKVRSKSLFNSIYGKILSSVIAGGTVLKFIGYDNTSFIMNDGKLYGTGRNNYGQLGLGNLIDKNTLTDTGLVIGSEGILGNSDGASIVIMSEGSIKACGRNFYGNLGLGHNNDVSNFTNIGLSIDNTKNSCCVGRSSYIIKDGNVFSTGLNSYGQLGLGDNVNRNVFTDTGITVDEGTGLSSVYTEGYGFQCIIKDGNVWSVGYNSKGQLGLGNITHKNVFTDTGFTVDEGTGVKSGNGNTFAIKNGTLWSTGRNDYGQLGLGDNAVKNVFTDTGISINSIDDLSLGRYYSSFVISDGKVLSTGKNNFGQLGIGHITDVYQFTDTLISADEGTTIKASMYSSYIIKDGNVWSVGYNSYGQLGLGDNVNRNVFTDTGILAKEGELYLNDRTCAFILNADSNKSTGNNGYGQLGVGDNVNRNVFTDIIIT